MQDFKKNKDEILKHWNSAFEAKNQDFEINVCLGYYHYNEGDIPKALKFWRSAFLINHYDINLNKMLFFGLHLSFCFYFILIFILF